MDSDENSRIIDVWGYLHRLGHHWLVMLAVFLLVMTAGSAWALTQPNQWEATQTVLVSLPAVDDEAQAMQQSASLVGTVAAYTKLSTMPPVTDPVLAAHPDIESLEALRLAVEVLPVGPLAIDISATGPDADATSSLVADLAASLAATAPGLVEAPAHLELALTPVSPPVVTDAGSGRLTRLVAVTVLALMAAMAAGGFADAWKRRRSD